MCFNCLIMDKNSLCNRKDLCGSCSWSDIPYEQQLANKLIAINKVAGEANVELTCTQIIPSVTTSNYRNRMDYVVNFKGEFGLREKGKWWKVLDNHTCFLPDTKIIELFNKIYPWIKNSGISYFDRKSYVGLLRYVVFRTTSLGETMVIVLTSSPKTPEESETIRRALLTLKEDIKVTSLIWSHTNSTSDISFGDTCEMISGAAYIKERINGYNYIIRPNSFFQTNSLTAGLLQQHVLSMVDSFSLSSDATLLDLYCGSGFFTLPLVAKYPHTYGIEIVQSAIDDALENSKLNNLTPTFICSASEGVDLPSYNPDFLLVDPPRAGLHPKVINDILAKPPKYLIYVSCKFEKFISELALLKEKFTVVNCTAIDMFPHTPHVEVITTLVRNP
jgi:23S rRNA (uracil-5-)-methyltransferase RumA